jgi:protein gp37
MGKTTGIEWTDSTWNPIRGCSRVSEGCRNCYAESVAARFSGPGRAYEGLAAFRVIGKGTPNERREPHWTGEVRLIEKHLEDPIRWKEPQKIFVNSMSDLFHPGVNAEWLAEIFGIMARAPQHTYQILTKRPERMLDVLTRGVNRDIVELFSKKYTRTWLPSNWWFGVSIEDQDSANHRLPILAECPAAVRFVSYEPAIGPVDFVAAMGADPILVSAFDWIICGGESGPNARPMHPDWARIARNQCSAAGVPFFFKQWGEFLPRDQQSRTLEAAPNAQHEFHRIGKKGSGAVLDGVEWKEFPQC